MATADKWNRELRQKPLVYLDDSVFRSDVQLTRKGNKYGSNS